MNILVTGCAGFIGSHLCERLIDDGHHVTGIDNFDPFYDAAVKESNLSNLMRSERFTFLNADITDLSHFQFLKHKPELVIHLAAKAGVRPSIDDPSAYLKTNIDGTLQVLELMRRENIDKIIFASSSSVYGNNSVPPFNEKGVTDFPISPYAFTKKSCELLLYNYFHLYRINSISLRFFTVYGPRQRPDLAIHKFFNAIINDEIITLYGDGSTERDYTYIDDIVIGICKAIDYIYEKTELFEVFNLGNNRPLKLSELILLIEETVGKKALIEFKEMQAGDVEITCADISHAVDKLNYAPQTAIRKGLQVFYSWKKNQL